MIRVVHNFLADPNQERALALKATYETMEHNGLSYRGMSEQGEGDECAKLRKALSLPDATIRTGYRRYLEDEENETYIHADADIATYTAVCFLNEPTQCKGGTAFWRYRPFNWDHVPSPETLVRQGLRDSSELWGKILRDGFDEFHWEMWNYVPMAWNRLLIFDSRLFHSRYPKRAFGSDVASGRLIKLYFIRA